jgi:hypothetical protein
LRLSFIRRRRRRADFQTPLGTLIPANVARSAIVPRSFDRGFLFK